MLRAMPWCVICRAEYAGSDSSACPRCGTGGEKGSLPERSSSQPTVDEPTQKLETTDSKDDIRPAHLAVLDPSRPILNRVDSERIAKRRLVSSAGPAMPVRKQANDSVPSSWMSRLEAARGSAQPGQSAPPPPLPPPLKREQANGSGSGPEKKADGPVGQPAHLLIAELQAEDERRNKADAVRAATLFADDRSAEIAKVEIKLDEEQIKKKRIPDWVVILVLVVVVLGAVAAIVLRVRKEKGPNATIDPVVAAQAERKRQAVTALEEGHKLTLEQKPDEAIRSYAKALELDPMMAGAERGLAIGYAAKNDDASSLEHYKAYLKLAPNAPDADDVRAIIDKYEKKKQQAAEAAALERAKAEERRAKQPRHRHR